MKCFDSNQECLFVYSKISAICHSFDRKNWQIKELLQFMVVKTAKNYKCHQYLENFSVHKSHQLNYYHKHNFR